MRRLVGRRNFDQRKVVWRGRPKFCNRDTNDGEMSQKKVRVRTSDHEIDTFSLRESWRKDAWVETDSLKHVDFVWCVEVLVLGTGEFYCVLPSHPSWVRGLKHFYRVKTPVGTDRTPRGCADWNGVRDNEKICVYRTSRRCADWNEYGMGVLVEAEYRHPYRWRGTKRKERYFS